MELEPLKDKLGDETFAKLKGYVDDLIGQRDTARSESISGRKGLRDKVAALEAAQTALLEKLGIESVDEVDALPDAKGAAEAAKQYEAKLKRMQRERDEAASKADGAEKKWRESLQRAAVAEALGGHDFVARDVVETYVGQRLAWEGEDLMYRTDDGKLVTVRDGVAGIAKTRPELLKPKGTGGAGFKAAGASGAGGAKTMTRAEFEAADQGARMAFAKAGGQVVDA